MANNRLYLIHKPTRMAFCIGKRMGWGWYCNDRAGIGERLDAFYDAVLDTLEGHQDDFTLGIEDGDNCDIPEWRYVPGEEKNGVPLMIPAKKDEEEQHET